MASFQLRDMLRTSVRTLMLLALAMPGMCFPQARLDANADRQREIIAAIEQERSRNGPYSESLIGPLTTLALFYQENGDRELAVATIERVRQVVRVNYGLYSLEQVPLIQQLIASEEANGDIEVAWGLEQELLALARRHPDDLRTVPIFRKAADSRTVVLKRLLSGEFPPEILIGCYYDFSEKEDCNSGTTTEAVRALRLDARRNYTDAINVILRNKLFSSAELRELQMSLVRNADLIRRYLEGRKRHRALSALSLTPLAPRFRSNYLAGRVSLEHLVGYELMAYNEDVTPASKASLVAALVRVADWDLLYSENQSALEGYKLAYEMLQTMRTTPSLVSELFSPETPVVLPAFRPSPLSSYQKTGQSEGHVDVGFEITKYGRSRRIEVLDTTMNASRDAESELIRVIKKSIFRPRLTNGQFGVSRVKVRYYLTE